MKDLKETNVAIFKVLKFFKKTVEAIDRLDQESAPNAEEDKRIWSAMTNRDTCTSMQQLWELREILESKTNVAAHPMIVATVLQLLWEHGRRVNADLKHILNELLPKEAVDVEWGPPKP